MDKLKRALPTRLKAYLKPWYRRGQQYAARALHAFGPDELASTLRSMGITAGDTLFVHSGLHHLSGFTGNADDIIDILTATIGPAGHLMMMSMAYRGSTEAYADQAPLFDVLRTPSAMGMISEVFRRREDVHRSASPFHPVLANGPKAVWLTADHDKLLYSCGPGSPFERFYKLAGKCLFYDASFESLTFMHYVEHRLQAHLPVSPYSDQARAMSVVDASGRQLQVWHYLYQKAARERRSFSAVEKALTTSGALNSSKLGNSTVMLVDSQAVVECCESIADRLYSQ